MPSNELAELLEQLRMLRLALSVLLPIAALLTWITLMAFVVYLLGTYQLCRAEHAGNQ